MANNRPRQGKRGQHDAAQPGMGVDSADVGYDCEMQLPDGWLTQQYVTSLHVFVAHAAEAITIQKGRNSAQIVPAQRVITWDFNCIAATCERDRNDTNAVETDLWSPPAQLERHPHQIQRADGDVRADIRSHRDNVSAGHCPVNRARREN